MSNISRDAKVDDHEIYPAGAPLIFDSRDRLIMLEERPVMRSMAMPMPEGPKLFNTAPKSAFEKEMLIEEEKNNTEIFVTDLTNPGTPLEAFEDIIMRSNWDINERSLAPFPAYHPLERTHCVISIGNASPRLIAARISDACVQMSLAARYSDSKCTAHLSSSDFCEMNVRLYASSAGEGERSATIVEVQRRRGDSLAFHRYAQKILAAAEGQEGLEFCNNAAPSIPHEEFKMKFHTQDRKNVIAALEIAGGLLKKDRSDANQLGMESLCLLTDPGKTGLITATMVSRAILTGSTRAIKESASPSLRKRGEGPIIPSSSFDEEDAILQSLDIRKTILSLIQFKKLSRDEGEDINLSDEESPKRNSLIDDEDSPDGNWRRSSFDSELSNVMHNLALAVLANALDMVAKDGSLCDTINQQQWLGDSALVQTLLDVLRKAETRPHDAMLSARCLASLVDASTKAIEHAMKLDALTVVNQAKNIGRNRHASLARETDHVYESLSSRTLTGTTVYM
eukprot:CAMPEP_0172434258 /NCGR_PEP_ID=MMETSP1064-20121228/70532_1 /TAXON_ID=202472 /ORGANISM="Aulacoseira subarctica , Strain CCAP 1002/5" /LENGTH=510 /DNA_ID=CAMNT_0013182463 /DNA_START=761 /DNA_END=2293 /DNA_ORIENTATION=-